MGIGSDEPDREIFFIAFDLIAPPEQVPKST